MLHVHVLIIIVGTEANLVVAKGAKATLVQVSGIVLAEDVRLKIGQAATRVRAAPTLVHAARVLLHERSRRTLPVVVVLA